MILDNGSNVRCDLCGWEWFQTPTLNNLGAYIQTPQTNKKPQGIYFYQHLCGECARHLHIETMLMLAKVVGKSKTNHFEKDTPTFVREETKPSSSSEPSQSQSEAPSSISPSER